VQLEERFLEHVLGQCGVAGEAGKKIEKLFSVPLDEFAERFDVAFQVMLEKFSVAQLA
jgi:hypothetical protein